MTKEKQQKPWKQYTKGRWPSWLKAILLKWWGAGAVLFFIGWGIPMNLPAVDMALVLGLVLGIFTDLVLNHFIQVFIATKSEWEPFVMWHQGGWKSLVLNVIHGILISFLVMLVYQGVNIGIIALFSLDPTTVPFGVEPIMYGLLYLGFDMLFICIKRRIQGHMKTAKEEEQK